MEKTKILGLVGYSVLQDFEILLNYREKYIRLSELNRKGELLEPVQYISPRIDSIRFRMGNHIPVIKVEVNGLEKSMGIDTGAEYNLLNIRSNKDIMDHFILSRRIRMRGASKDYAEALGGHLYRLKLNNKYPCAGMATVLTGFRNINELVGFEIDGIMGYEFLSPWIFSLNYKKRKLYLHRIKYKVP